MCGVEVSGFATVALLHSSRSTAVTNATKTVIAYQSEGIRQGKLVFTAYSRGRQQYTRGHQGAQRCVRVPERTLMKYLRNNEFRQCLGLFVWDKTW
jgi:hypothetical protein